MDTDPPKRSDDPLVLYRGSGSRISRRGLLAFARSLRDEVAGGRSFQCLLTNDLELCRLNAQFLVKDSPTDVLSFPASEAPPAAGCLGEIAISAERAAEQAAAFGHTPEEEVRLLMLHGVLHLLGFDHEKDRGAMAREESRWRSRFGLPQALTERRRG